MTYEIILTLENGHRQTVSSTLSYVEVTKDMDYIYKDLKQLGCVRFENGMCGRSPLETIKFTRDNNGICTYSVKAF